MYHTLTHLHSKGSFIARYTKAKEPHPDSIRHTNTNQLHSAYTKQKSSTYSYHTYATNTCMHLIPYRTLKSSTYTFIPYNTQSSIHSYHTDAMDASRLPHTPFENKCTLIHASFIQNINPIYRAGHCPEAKAHYVPRTTASSTGYPPCRASYDSAHLLLLRRSLLLPEARVGHHIRRHRQPPTTHAAIATHRV